MLVELGAIGVISAVPLCVCVMEWCVVDMVLVLELLKGPEPGGGARASPSLAMTIDDRLTDDGVLGRDETNYRGVPYLRKVFLIQSRTSEDNRVHAFLIRIHGVS